MDQKKDLDVIVIGGGQSGLACGYYLRRTGLDYLILDDNQTCGGSWNHYWDSLTLFSPAEQSSLPGWMMPKTKKAFPVNQEVIDYLCQYEKRYELKIQRPIEVLEVHHNDGLYILKTSQGEYRCKALIAATGSFKSPLIPKIEGQEEFQGLQLHSSQYRNLNAYRNKKVLIVGEGNSGAQILAEVSKVASTQWASLKPPSFLPDDVDGRVLFNEASAKYYAQKKGEQYTASTFTLGNIVMLPPILEARDRGVLQSKGGITRLWEHGGVWYSGEKEEFDVIIWCTGYSFATAPLSSIVNRDPEGKVKTSYTRAVDSPGLWLVGYGSWTGYASATLIAVGRSARQTIRELEQYLDENQNIG